jgi:hypothetical protein
MLFCGLVIIEVNHAGGVALTETRKTKLLLIWAMAVVASFSAYSPLTYFQPISNSSLERLAFLDLWDLRCPGCERTNQLAFELKKNRELSPEYLKLALGPLVPFSGKQGWGKPRLGLTVAGKPMVIGGVEFSEGFGVHAESSLKYRIAQRYQRLLGAAGVPDYLASEPASVVFEIRGDGKQLWQSGLLLPGQKAVSFAVDLNQVEVLELRVTDGGDTLDHDHACWLGLSLVGKEAQTP